MNVSTAVVTGVLGQDGGLLCEALLKRGFRVFGVCKPGTPLESLRPYVSERLEIETTNLLEQSEVDRLLARTRPDFVYNLAARASSANLSDDPVETCKVNALMVGFLLDGIRRMSPQSRFCQAGSSEIFGDARESPQDEASGFRPRNPYGAAKLMAHVLTQTYREKHGIFACNAILYNHESNRRSPHFVSKKVCRAAVAAGLGMSGKVRIGDLDAQRDWGYAPDFIKALVAMAEAGEPDDYVIATGKLHSVRQLCEIAFSVVGLDYRDHILVDDALRRPKEECPLVGNWSKARRKLGWSPTVSFQEMVALMVNEEIRALENAREFGDVLGGNR